SWAARARTEGRQAPSTGARGRAGPAEGDTEHMSITRRTLVRGLGAGVLGAGALSGCSQGGGIGRGRRRRPTTTEPTAGDLEEPDQPLVIGQIGASYGRMARFEEAIAVSIDEARVDVNARWE